MNIINFINRVAIFIWHAIVIVSLATFYVVNWYPEFLSQGALTFIVEGVVFFQNAPFDFYVNLLTHNIGASIMLLSFILLTVGAYADRSDNDKNAGKVKKFKTKNASLKKENDEVLEKTSVIIDDYKNVVKKNEELEKRQSNFDEYKAMAEKSLLDNSAEISALLVELPKLVNSIKETDVSKLKKGVSKLIDKANSASEGFSIDKADLEAINSGIASLINDR